MTYSQGGDAPRRPRPPALSLYLCEEARGSRRGDGYSCSGLQGNKNIQGHGSSHSTRPAIDGIHSHRLQGRPGVRRQALAGLDTAGTCTRMDMVLLRLYVYKKCHASACALACSPSGTITRTPTQTLPRRLGRPPARTGPHPGRRYHSQLRRSPSTVASFQRNTYRPPPP